MPPVIASNFAVSGANDYVTTSNGSDSRLDCTVPSIAPAVDLEGYEGTTWRACEDLSKSDLVSPLRIFDEIPLASMPLVRILSPESFYRSCFKTTTSITSPKPPARQRSMLPDDSDVSDITYGHQKNRLPDLSWRFRPIL